MKPLFFIGLAWLSFAAPAQVPFREPDHKARLGELHYGNRAGGLIAQEGPTVVTMVREEGETLETIEVAVTPPGHLVKGLRLGVRRADGSLKSVAFGNPDGRWLPQFRVPPGRVLVGISGACGWFVDNLRFHFDDGSTTPLYGGTGGDTAFQLLLARRADGTLKGRFRGFWGSSTEFLESIGLLFFPEE